MPTFAIHTLGCRANQADSQRLREILAGAGFREVPFGEPADVQVVNTCTVTREADRKSRQFLRRALRRGGRVVATGCSVADRGGNSPAPRRRREGTGPRLPGAVLRLPPDRREAILDMLGAAGCPDTRAVEAEVRRGRTRALLKVQDGCDQFCTFCIVPYVRGRSRSQPPGRVFREARRLEARGYREIVLTGIHLAAWGRDLPGRPDLADLLEGLLEATSTPRFRLSSIEPQGFPTRILELMGRQPRRLCPHLHLALQHASDPLLKRMRRGYTRARYEALAERFMTTVEGACLTSDVMVGFPGESEADFEELLRFVGRIPFYRLHVFPYSIRPGTAAARFSGRVEPAVVRERMRRLLALAEQRRLEFLRRFEGSRRRVLVEGVAGPGRVRGLTDNYLPVIFPGRPDLSGNLVTVELGPLRGGALTGRLVGEDFPSPGDNLAS